MAAWAVVAAMTATVASCDDDDKLVGEPYFYVEGAEDGIVHMNVAGLDKSSWSFGAGDHYIVRANGHWELVPQDESTQEWMRIFPDHGDGEGILRFYAVANPVAATRYARYTVILEGQPLDIPLVLAQEPAGPTLNVTANNIQFKQAGGSNEVFVSSNYEWAYDIVAEGNWLDVQRTENTLYLAVNEANRTGSDRVATINIHGVGEFADLVTPITVTQLDAIYFDDFGWCYTPMVTDVEFCDQPNLDAVVCWGDQLLRIDKWIEPVKSDNPGWTGVRGTKSATAGPYTYSRYKYILFGTSNKCAGNICSPCIDAIEGAVNARVSWSMAGFVSAKNAQEAGNEFWVAILGPGKITAANAGGASKASIMTGSATIPYEASGDTPAGAPGTHDIDLTEVSQFYIDKTNGYFNTNEPTGLLVWDQPETKFSIDVEGMTAQTRIVFIACDAENLTMETGEGWDVRPGGSKYKSNRKLFDNFKVVGL